MDDTFLDQLRSGGYIFYCRHGEATSGEDGPDVDFSSCETQRNLSPRGRAQAAAYGVRLRQLNIPVNHAVITSLYCRTIETAQLAFPGAYVRLDTSLTAVNDIGRMTPAEQESVLGALTLMLEVMPPYGSNQFIIDHSFPDHIGLGRIPYMGTVVIRPLGPGNGYEIAARFTLQELTNLASLYS